MNRKETPGRSGNEQKIDTGKKINRKEGLHLLYIVEFTVHG